MNWRIERVGNDACEEINGEVEDAAMARVLNLTRIFELVKYRLNEVAFV